MIVRNHIWVADRCMVCRLPRDLAADSTCDEREDYQRSCPEPVRRQIACEDQATIAARIADLYRERTEAMNTETV